MACVLRISGKVLDVDSLVGQLALQPYRTWRNGEARGISGKSHADSGACFVASDADLEELPRQVEEAAAFLEAHASSIARAAGFPGVDHAVLDFGVAFGPDTAARFLYLPARLIQLAADAGLAVELSVYACSGEHES
jgi:hypothetical protein